METSNSEKFSVEKTISKNISPIFLIMACLSQLLSISTTYSGIYELSANQFVAVVGCAFVQIGLFASLFKLTDRHEQVENEKRKPIGILLILTIAFVSFSGLTSAIGFYKATQHENSISISIKEHNQNELSEAKNAFEEVKDAAVSKLTKSLKLDQEELNAKEIKISQTKKKSELRNLQAEIKVIKDRIKPNKSLLEELPTLNYDQDVNDAKFEDDKEVLKAVESIHATANILASKVGISSADNKNWVDGLAYNHLAATDMVGTFVTNIRKGVVSAWLILILGYAIDVTGILVMLGRKNPTKAKFLVKDFREWRRALWKELWSTSEPLINAAGTQNGIDHIAKIIIKNKGKELKKYKILLEELSDDFFHEKISQLTEKVCSEFGLSNSNNSTYTMLDWKNKVITGIPIVVEIPEKFQASQRQNPNGFNGSEKSSASIPSNGNGFF